MSLKDYSIEQLLSEVCRRSGDNVKINDRLVSDREQITLTDLSGGLARRLFKTRMNIKKDHSLQRYEFKVIDGIKIHVEYRYILVDGLVVPELEDISVSIVAESFYLSARCDDFIDFFFPTELLEDFFWDYLHGDLPSEIVSIEDIEELVKDVQADLDIPESEAYDIVYRLLGVE